METFFLQDLHSNLPVIYEVVRIPSHTSANKRLFWLFVKEWQRLCSVLKYLRLHFKYRLIYLKKISLYNLVYFDNDLLL